MPHWKNYFILILVRFFQLFEGQIHEGRGEPNRFLIVSTTGLGDTLWATPAIRALRESHPDAYIGCLTTPLGASVLQNNPHLNELFIFRGVPSLLKLYFNLRKKKIGTVLLFHTSQRALLPLCCVIGATKLVGTKGLQKGLDTLLTEAIPWNFSHEIERRLDLVRAAGAKPTTYHLEFFITETDRASVPEKFAVGLHPGAKDRFKQWPPSYFVKVGEKLRKKTGCDIIVTGTPHEKELVDSICREIEGAIAVIEPLNIMGAVLEKLTLFITNDTGPLHLALAMKTPTIALFSPTNPAICGPYHNTTAQVFYRPPTCRPCLKKKCRDPFCMRQISPDEVIQAASEKLKARV